MNKKRTIVFTLRGLINSGLVNPKHVCICVDFGDAWLEELRPDKNYSESYSDYLDYEVLRIESTGHTNQICVVLKGKNYNEEAASNSMETMTIGDLKEAIENLPDNMNVLIPLYEDFDEEFPVDHRYANIAGVVNDCIYGSVFTFGVTFGIISNSMRMKDIYTKNNYVVDLFPNSNSETNSLMTISDLKKTIENLPYYMEVFIPLYYVDPHSNKLILKDIGEVKIAGIVNDKTYGKGFSLIITPDITTLGIDDFYRPNSNIDYTKQLYPIIEAMEKHNMDNKDIFGRLAFDSNRFKYITDHYIILNYDMYQEYNTKAVLIDFSKMKLNESIIALNVLNNCEIEKTIWDPVKCRTEVYVSGRQFHLLEELYEQFVYSSRHQIQKEVEESLSKDNIVNSITPEDIKNFVEEYKGYYESRNVSKNDDKEEEQDIQLSMITNRKELKDIFERYYNVSIGDFMTMTADENHNEDLDKILCMLCSKGVLFQLGTSLGDILAYLQNLKCNKYLTKDQVKEYITGAFNKTNELYKHYNKFDNRV